MSTTSQRVTVIAPAFLAHVIDNPARGRAWSVRELAAVVGTSASMIGHLRTGERTTVQLDLAWRIADAVGCHPANLFAGSVLTDSVDSQEAS
jgi:DNA-binding Xre family transcriptional regulator